VKLGDARTLLADMPSESVDMILTDPPYRVISGGNRNPNAPAGVLAANDGRIFEHNDIDVIEYAADLFRVLRSPGHLWMFINEKNRVRFEAELTRVGFITHLLGGWIKNTCTPNRWGMKNVEPVLMMRKGGARAFYDCGVKQFEACDNIVGDKVYPTEKPVRLLERYLSASSLPGHVVLDPFMGGGSTGVAAIVTGRNFIGFEVDPAYYGVACRRMGVMP
jgi:site-specific DNA-methyltransferase (adenine-specific)